MSNRTGDVKMIVKKLGISLLMWMVFSMAYALPPQAPILSIEIEGLQASAQWNYAGDASGYRLLYTYAPNRNNGTLDIGAMQTIELGTQASFTTLLKNGDGYYVALQAYNGDGDSPLSNLEYFKLDKKIVVLLPTTTDANVTAAQLKEGIKQAFADKGTEQRVRLEIADSWTDNEQLAKLLYGARQTDAETGTQGYIDDPNVLAIVTGTTDNALAITSQLRDDRPLVVSCTATSTILQNREGLLLMAPSNNVQADKMHQQLSTDATNDTRMLKYAVILGNDPNIAIYSIDLYIQLLSNVFSVEAAIQAQDGLDNEGNVQPFAQMVGTFTFDGTAAQAERLADVMNALAPDAALYVGSSSSFKTLYDKNPTLKWVISDGSYKYEDFKDGDVRKLTFGGEDSQNVYQNLGYDAGGFLDKIIDTLGDSRLERSMLLAGAQEITYTGKTGTKGFAVEENGQYDIQKAGDNGWEKVE